MYAATANVYAKMKEGHCKLLQLEAYITLTSGTRMLEVGWVAFWEEVGGGWVPTRTIETPLQITRDITKYQTLKDYHTEHFVG